MPRTISIEAGSNGEVRVRSAVPVDGKMTKNHRMMLTPGVDVDAELGRQNAAITSLFASPISDDDLNVIRGVCATEHTPEKIAAYAAAHAPPPPTPEQIRAETFNVDADRIEMLDRLRSATPAQIKTYVQNNVTDLASAKVVLAKILLILSAPH
jgi:hypothetical protein